LSEVTGFVVAIDAKQAPVLAVVVIFAGHVMVGAIISDRVKLKEQVPTLLAPSVAVIVMSVIPVPVRIVPAAGVCVTTIEPVAVQLSLTVTSEI
jgi:hypothetical protein